jgi:hypothetical protein
MKMYYHNARCCRHRVGFSCFTVTMSVLQVLPPTGSTPRGLAMRRQGHVKLCFTHLAPCMRYSANSRHICGYCYNDKCKSIILKAGVARRDPGVRHTQQRLTRPLTDVTAWQHEVSLQCLRPSQAYSSLVFKRTRAKTAPLAMFVPGRGRLVQKHVLHCAYEIEDWPGRA